MAILEPALIGELAAAITAAMQVIKSSPKIKGSQIPYISGFVGAGAGIGWYLVGGDLSAPGSFWGIDWQDGFRGLINGVAGAVTANGAYNIQKFLPMKNILPTAGELEEHKLKEELASKARNETALAEGVTPPSPESPPATPPEITTETIAEETADAKTANTSVVG